MPPPSCIQLGGCRWLLVITFCTSALVLPASILTRFMKWNCLPLLSRSNVVRPPLMVPVGAPTNANSCASSETFFGLLLLPQAPRVAAAARATTALIKSRLHMGYLRLGGLSTSYPRR